MANLSLEHRLSSAQGRALKRRLEIELEKEMGLRRATAASAASPTQGSRRRAMASSKASTVYSCCASPKRKTFCCGSASWSSPRLAVFAATA